MTDRRKTHLHTPHILGTIRPRHRPPVLRRRIRLRHPHTKILKHATEKLEIRHLHRIDPDIVAQLHHHELCLPNADAPAGTLLRPRPCRPRARRQHVPVLLRRQYRRRRLGRPVRHVHARRAVHVRIVEPVREGHPEVRGDAVPRVCRVRRVVCEGGITISTTGSIIRVPRLATARRGVFRVGGRRLWARRCSRLRVSAQLLRLPFFEREQCVLWSLWQGRRGWRLQAAQWWAGVQCAVFEDDGPERVVRRHRV